MSQLSCHKQVDRESILRLRNLIKDLPSFCSDSFHGIEPRASSRTRIVYAYDPHVSFGFLHRENPAIARITVKNIMLDQLNQLSVTDFKEYARYLEYHFNDRDQGVMSKGREIIYRISSLESFYNYYCRNGQIKNNPVALVQLPRLHEEEAIRLDADEVALLPDEAEQGDKLADRRKSYHAKTKARDLALLTLLLGTGIRVFECVGLNISDVDLRNSGIHICRKGSREVTIHFGTEMKDALLNYLEEYNRTIPRRGHEDIPFLPLQCRWMTVRSVENLVKKYARTVTPLKSITPHKLCNAYGTNLHRETGGIYLVADVPGHSDVNTTRHHYTALEDERRRSIRNKIRLREKWTIHSGLFLHTYNDPVLLLQTRSGSALVRLPMQPLTPAVHICHVYVQIQMTIILPPPGRHSDRQLPQAERSQ